MRVAGEHDSPNTNNNNTLNENQDKPIPKIIIFLSDGKGDYIPSNMTGSLANVAKEQGYKIYTIGLELETEPQAINDLKDIASASGGLYLSSPTADNLQQIFSHIYERVKSETSPLDINIKEVLQPYVILDTNPSSFNVVPTSINETEDGTVIEWRNISQHVGNSDGRLDANETFIVNFKIGSSRIGNGLPIGINGSSSISWFSTNEGKEKILALPELYVNVLSGEPTLNQTATTTTITPSPVAIHHPPVRNDSFPSSNGNLTAPSTAMAAVPSAEAESGSFLLFTINPGATDSYNKSPITPTQASVPVGTNVTWINNDVVSHQIASAIQEGGPDNIFYGRSFDANGGAYSIILESPGFYSFYDPFWYNIRVNVTVTPDSQ